MFDVRIVLAVLVLATLASKAYGQDWSVSISAQPPATVQVGDIIGVSAQIAVDAGANSLSVDALYSGAATSGISNINFPDAVPFGISSGSSHEISATGTVVAAPGSSGAKLEISVDGTYGALAGTRTVSTENVAVAEGVSATLAGGAAQVRRGEQISYGLTLTNESDSGAEIAVPNAGFAVPAGTALVMRSDGAVSLAAGASTNFDLVVEVSNADPDGFVVAMTPANVTYAMSQIGLSSRAVAIAPSSVTSIVVVPIFHADFESP